VFRSFFFLFGGVQHLLLPQNKNNKCSCAPLLISNVFLHLFLTVSIFQISRPYTNIYEFEIYMFHTHTHTHTHLPVYKRKFRNKNGLPFSTKKTKNPPPMKSLPWSLPRYTLYIYTLYHRVFSTNLSPSLFLTISTNIFAKKKKCENKWRQNNHQVKGKTKFSKFFKFVHL
jgi:hypothetical protein